MTNLPALGERTVWIDCDVIQADGGTRTASITGAFVALALALDTLRQRDVLRTIPLSDYVAAISVGIVDGEPLLDLAYEDDSRADVDMNIVKTGDGRFIEVQGTAEAMPFGHDSLLTLLALADHGIKQLIEKQRAIVGQIVPNREGQTLRVQASGFASRGLESEKRPQRPERLAAVADGRLAVSGFGERRRRTAGNRRSGRSRSRPPLSARWRFGPRRHLRFRRARGCRPARQRDRADESRRRCPAACFARSAS